MDNVISWLSANWVNILAIYGAAVALASAIVKATPSQSDDAILAKVVKVLDWFSVAYPKKG